MILLHNKCKRKIHSEALLICIIPAFSNMIRDQTRWLAVSLFCAHS